jgi:DNA polymerase I-like protein with 3'-5' exonuclease and polymerase domains
MDDRVSITRPWFKEYKFHLIQSIDQLKKLVDICIQRKLCALDLETTGVDNRIYSDEYFEDGVVTRHGIRTVDRIAGICISFDGSNGYYVPLSHEPEDSGNLPWDATWDEITRLVNNCRIIFHNKKFDAEFLYPVTGKEYWSRDDFEDIFLMAKVINPLKGFPAGLKPLTKLHFGVDMVELDELFTQEKKEQLKREKRQYNFALLHPKEGLEYGCSDGIFTYKLLPGLQAKLSDGDRKIYDLEKTFTNVVRKMERTRVHIDVDRVQQLYVECKAAIEQVGDIIRNVIESKTGKTGKWLTLNVGAPAQLSKALITDTEGLKLKPTQEMIGNEETGWSVQDSDDDDDDDDEIPQEKQYSLKDEALKSLHRAYGERLSVQRPGVVKDGKPHPESIFELILEYRHYDKMKGSYIEKLFQSHDKYGDVRPSFNQMGTDTARMSCKAGKIADGYSGVNFQGIPRDSDEDKPELFKLIRTCIVPRPGWILVKLDFAGEELRVVTNLSGDPIWTKSFLYEDGDVHSITSRTLFGKPDVNKDERNRGKRCNFAFIYGGGAGAIQRNIGCSIEDAQRHMDNLKRDVPVLMGYVEHQKQFARKHKCVFTAYGRRLPIPTIDSPIRAIRSKAERCAINYTIQSTSADILKFALCFVDKNIRTLGWEDRVRYVLTVHDEVVYEIKPEYLMEIVRKLDEWMTYPWKLPKAHGRPWVVPLLTEPGIDINWKARFDYFKMVDGLPVPKDGINEDGTYRGKLLKDGTYDPKLKKDEFFADGRIYQKVPDFLKDWIRKIPPRTQLPAPEVATELPAPAPTPMLPASVQEGKVPEPVSESVATEAPVEAPPETPAPEPASESGEPVKTKESRSISDPEPAMASGLTMDFSLDDVGPDLGSFSSDDSFGIGEMPASLPSKETSKEAPKAAPKEVPPKVVESPSQKTNGAITTKPAPVEDASLKPIQDGETILRWSLQAIPSEYAMKKLHAVCILAEGNTLLRMVNPKGEIIMGEDAGIRVDPDQFKFLTRLFGLG